MHRHASILAPCSHQTVGCRSANTSADFSLLLGVCHCHTLRERPPWITMRLQMNDYLHIWISKETELVKYLSRQGEDCKGKISSPPPLPSRQQPARHIMKSLWQVISVCIHHMTFSVFPCLSRHLLCLFFTLKKKAAFSLPYISNIFGFFFKLC